MFVIQILIILLIGYTLGYLRIYNKFSKKEKECLNKKQMIENRDMLIGKQEEQIKELKKNSLKYEQIKHIYKTESKLITRHDKVEELIEKDSINSTGSILENI